MINSHCGKRLKRLYGEPTYTEDCKTKKRTKLGWVWICQTCRKQFRQAIRLPKS